MVRTMRWPVAAVAVMLALALVAASCGDDDSGTAPSVSSSSTNGGTSSSTTEALLECPSPQVIPDQLNEVDILVADTLVTDWQLARHDSGYTANPCWHDWTTDDCSAPGLGSTGVSFNFTHPCHRHDFGCRNYKRVEAATAQDTWNEVNKLSIDDQLLADMREHCSGRPWYLKNQCFAWAQVFYWAVRAFG